MKFPTEWKNKNYVPSHQPVIDDGTMSPQAEIPSGKRLQFAIENGPVEIVDLPIKHCDFP
jgi:hypothetical protein